MPNVFVSYRESDAVKARRLASDLSAAGHRVWFAEWEISLGDSIVGKINQGLGQAQYLVLCCSKDGQDSPWMSREWMSALACQLDGHGVRILPILLSGGAPPPILADLRYADLMIDWNKGLRELLTAIK